MAGAALTIPEGAGITKLRWRCVGIAEEVIATFGWELDTGSPISTANVNARPDAAALAWQEAWEGAFGLATLQADWTFLGCDVSIWPSAQTAGGTPVAPNVGSKNVTATGSGTWRCCPANCALLVEKNTALGGRPGKGRAYLPGGYLSSGEVVASGGISSTALAGYNANLEQLQTNLGDNAVGIFLRLFHGQRKSGDTVIGPGGAATEVTSLTADARVATQRRRMHR